MSFPNICHSMTISHTCTHENLPRETTLRPLWSRVCTVQQQTYSMHRHTYHFLMCHMCQQLYISAGDLSTLIDTEGAAVKNKWDEINVIVVKSWQTAVCSCSTRNLRLCTPCLCMFMYFQEKCFLKYIQFILLRWLRLPRCISRFIMTPYCKALHASFGAELETFNGWICQTAWFTVPSAATLLSLGLGHFCFAQQ